MNNRGKFTPVPRDGHRMKGTGSTEIPGHYMSIATIGRRADNRCSKRVRVDELEWWNASYSTIRSGTVKNVTYTSHDKASELWGYINSQTQERKPLWVFGVDLSYSLTLLDFWGALERGVFQIGPIHPGEGEERVRGKRPWKGTLCVERSPVFATVMGRHGKIHFADVLNYCPAGITDMVKALGDDELPQEPVWNDHAGRLDYVARLRQITQQFMARLITGWQRNDGGCWSRTVAGLSLSSFKRHIGKSLKEDEKSPLITARHDTAEVIERQGYFGGLTEPYKLGVSQGLFYKLDVSSLYPSVMAEGLFPSCRTGILEHPTPRELMHKIEFGGATATVDICSDTESFPVWHNNLFLFGKGSFTTTLCGDELKRGLRSGAVTHVHEAVIYKTAPLFRDWVYEWYKRKADASALGVRGMADRTVAKMVLNSLYGKFAQNGKYWTTKPGGRLDGSNYGAWVEVTNKGEVVECRAIAGVRQELRQGDPPSHYFPAISAFVTAAGRERMRFLMSFCPPKSVYYLGVDMLIVDEDGFRELDRLSAIQRGQLGCLELQGTASEIEIVSPNWYRFGSEWTRSGGWGRVKYDADGIAFYDATDRLPSILAQQPDGTVITREKPLGEHERWAKGYVDKDGWVSPYRLKGIKSQKPAG